MLVVRRQGSGTYVSGTPSRKIPLLNTDFSGSLSQHAPDLTRRLDFSDWRNANEEVAALLHSFAGARVLFGRRIDLLDNTPVAYDEIYLPEPVADRLSESDLAQLDFLHHWQLIQQFRIGHLTQGIEAVAAGPEQAVYLRIAEGAPALKELDVVFLHTGCAVRALRKFLSARSVSPHLNRTAAEFWRKSFNIKRDGIVRSQACCCEPLVAGTWPNAISLD